MGYAERNFRVGPTNDENQNHCTTRKEMLRLDWRIHLSFPIHIPTDVDQQTRMMNLVHRLFTENASKHTQFYNAVYILLEIMGKHRFKLRIPKKKKKKKKKSTCVDTTA